MKPNLSLDITKLLCGQSLCAIVAKNDSGDLILNYIEPKEITINKIIEK